MKLKDLPKGQALLVKVGATEPTLVDIDWPSLDFYQKTLNGYIEHLPFTTGGEPFLAVFDEEGLTKKLPFNELASHIANAHLVGDVIFINPIDLK